jgi:hypothetical protein
MGRVCLNRLGDRYHGPPTLGVRGIELLYKRDIFTKIYNIKKLQETQLVYGWTMPGSKLSLGLTLRIC